MKPNPAHRWLPQTALQRIGIITATALIALLGIALAMGVQAQSPSPDNPQPLADDVLLPLPCDRSMAFRRIDLPASSDARSEIQVGQPLQGEPLYPQPLASAFADADGTAYLLLGKYELSAGQQALLQSSGTGIDCAAGPYQARQPATGLSWLDALAVAAHYSQWLKANLTHFPDCAANSTSPCIPRIDGIAAQLRLPTAVEWEYAARGGTDVSPWAYQQRHFPTDGGLERYAWLLANADRDPMPIGTRKPSPLGLHDLLGNVEEWMLEPYRVRYPQTLGLVGACELRGGSYLSPRDALASGARRQYSCYQGNGDIGARLLVAAPPDVLAQRLDTMQALSQPSIADLPASGTGGIRVVADVDGMVSIDGVEVGRVSPDQPLLVEDLAVGEHYVSLHVEDNAPVRESYSIEANRFTNARFQRLENTTRIDPDTELQPLWSPQRREAALALTPRYRQEIEQKLKQMGYNPGPVDGVFDAQTRTAIKALQEKHGQEATGYVDNALIEQLLISDG